MSMFPLISPDPADIWRPDRHSYVAHHLWSGVVFSESHFSPCACTRVTALRSTVCCVTAAPAAPKAGSLSPGPTKPRYDVKLYYSHLFINGYLTPFPRRRCPRIFPLIFYHERKLHCVHSQGLEGGLYVNIRSV